MHPFLCLAKAIKRKNMIIASFPLDSESFLVLSFDRSSNKTSDDEEKYAREKHSNHGEDFDLIHHLQSTNKFCAIIKLLVAVIETFNVTHNERWILGLEFILLEFWSINFSNVIKDCGRTNVNSTVNGCTDEGWRLFNKMLHSMRFSIFNYTPIVEWLLTCCLCHHYSHFVCFLFLQRFMVLEHMI